MRSCTLYRFTVSNCMLQGGLIEPLQWWKLLIIIFWIQQQSIYRHTFFAHLSHELAFWWKFVQRLLILLYPKIFMQQLNYIKLIFINTSEFIQCISIEYEKNQRSSLETPSSLSGVLAPLNNKRKGFCIANDRKYTRISHFFVYSICHC